MIECSYNEFKNKVQKTDMNSIDDVFSDKHIVFDIETIRKTKTFDDLDDKSQELWYDITEKHKEFESYIKNDIPASKIYEERAGLYPEYLTIVSICFGIYYDNDNYVSSLSLNDGTEEEILRKFADLLLLNPSAYLVGYNVINFDIDILWKKMLFYNIRIPKQLNTRIVKPWEVKVIDIMLKWQGTRYSFIPSMDMIANYLGLGTSKDKLDGSKVSPLYWDLDFDRSENVDRITDYCKSDVDICLKIFRKIKDNI